MSHMHYLPLAPRFFAILVGFFVIVLILRSAIGRLFDVSIVGLTKGAACKCQFVYIPFDIHF